MKIAKFASIMSAILYITLFTILLGYYYKELLIFNLEEFYLNIYEYDLAKIVFDFIDNCLEKYNGVFKYGSLIFLAFHSTISLFALNECRGCEHYSGLLICGLVKIFTLAFVSGLICLISYGVACSSRNNLGMNNEVYHEEFAKYYKNWSISEKLKKGLFNRKKDHRFPIISVHNNMSVLWLLMLGPVLIFSAKYDDYYMFILIPSIVIILLLLRFSYKGVDKYKRALKKAERIFNGSDATIEDVMYSMQNVMIIDQGYDYINNFTILFSNKKMKNGDYYGLICRFNQKNILIKATITNRRETLSN